MTASTLVAPAASLEPAILEAISEAISRVAPLWPLKHFVAVNPFLGYLDRPFGEACGMLRRTTGAAPLQAPVDYLAAWRAGEITAEDLEFAAAGRWTADELVAALESPDEGPEEAQVRTVAECLDANRPHAHWSVFVVEEISKWCGVSCDENQTTWRSPWKGESLYAAWREAARHDRNPESFGLPGFRGFVTGLPESADECIARCVAGIAPDRVPLEDFLHRQLVTISGWAGHARYLAREDELRGRSNPVVKDLLAIRLAYDAALFENVGRDGVFRADWRHQRAGAKGHADLEAMVVWQGAYERGYQRLLGLALASQVAAAPAARPAMQAVFCIDVRSEVMRRHLEAAAPGLRTSGFAGFFGFPVAHRDADGAEAGARCPVLLVPPVTSHVCGTVAGGKRATAGTWKAFQNSAASCFSFVETAGMLFAGSLARLSGRAHGGCRHERPVLPAESVSVETRASMAAGALRNMSLTGPFARLVLICGHGSRSANNPYASGLDCGACGGHAGDVNARLAADTFNDPAVRARLALEGIVIPDDTVFLAGLHDTTTDEVTLFDDAVIPESHVADLAALKMALLAAGAACRSERAASLGLADVSGARLEVAMQGRATDISQVRPEWALANNAALVVAPRSRSAGLPLDGRVFLHDYDSSADTDDKVLTLILSAPVVVASWINLQYYASRIDPARLGSGNKTLHNVIGGIGALEGNGGDLKVGLPLQSIHNGSRFIHEPRRLSVYIEASPERLDQVLADLPGTRRLFDNGWIHLFSLDGGDCLQRGKDGWKKIA